MNHSSSFSKTLFIAGPAFVSGFMGYLLFSGLKGNPGLHTLTKQYIHFFLDNINYLDMGLILALTTILVGFLVLSTFMRYIFDSMQNYARSRTRKNIEEFVFTCILAVAFGGFALSIFSPYMEHTRYTYDFYNIMLGVEILIMSYVGLTLVCVEHYLCNSELSPLPGFLRNIQSQFKKDSQYVHNQNQTPKYSSPVMESVEDEHYDNTYSFADLDKDIRDMNARNSH